MPYIFRKYDRLLFQVLILLLFASPVWAAAPAPSTESLLKRIEKLEANAKRVAIQNKMALAEVHRPFPSLNIIGFTDLSFSKTTQAGKSAGFKEGEFILHFSSALSSRISYFAALSITARPDAGTGEPKASGFDTEIQRSLISFQQSDALKISFGRDHTPISWWNSYFHHGAWLQTTVARPEMIGVFLPLHFLGAQIEGTIPGAPFNMSYLVAVGNGRGRVISRAGDTGDVDNNKAWVLSLRARPNRLFGLEFGGAAYGDKISKSDGQQFREIIASGYVRWDREDPEFIAEFSNVYHEAVGGGTVWENRAFYVQMAYRLPLYDARLKPYVRFESSDIDANDIAFDRLSLSQKRLLSGLRIDLNTYAALKLEYRYQKETTRREDHTAIMQLSFTF